MQAMLRQPLSASTCAPARAVARGGEARVAPRRTRAPPRSEPTITTGSPEPGARLRASRSMVGKPSAATRPRTRGRRQVGFHLTCRCATSGRIGRAIWPAESGCSRSSILTSVRIPAAAASRGPSQLPAPRTVFIGRRPIRRPLTSTSRPDACTLMGVGGCGKTWLADRGRGPRARAISGRSVLRRVSRRSRRGMVSRPLWSGSRWGYRISRSVRDRAIRPRSRSSSSRRVDVLLGLENCEHVVDVCVVWSTRSWSAARLFQP